MKKTLLLAMTTALLVTMPYVGSPAYAQDAPQEGQKKEERQGPPRRQKMTLPEMQLVLSQKYFVAPETTKALIEKGVDFQDLNRAALYSFISGKSVEDILALKHDEPWQRVEVLIGAVGQKAYDKKLELSAINLERWWKIPKKVGLSYLKKGYPMHYVKVAWVLSKHSDWTMDAILKDKKYPENWKAWCQRNLGITPETYDEWINEYPNPTYLPGKFF